MGSDAFRSLFTLYQSKKRVSEQIQMLDQLRSSTDEDWPNSVGASSSNAALDASFQVGNLCPCLPSVEQLQVQSGINHTDIKLEQTLCV